MTIYHPPTQNALQKTLDSALNVGVTSSVTLNNTTGVQNKAGIIVVNRIDSDGNLKSAALREFIAFTGTSGNTLTGLTRALGGSTDQDHGIGSVVEFVWDVTAYQGLLDSYVVEHNEAGTHKAALVTTLKASAAEVTTGTEDAKIVTPKNLRDATHTFTSPKIITGINDTNGNELLKVTATGSAVNELTLVNAATGNNPALQATGGDTNIGITLTPKGTGIVNLGNTSMAGATPASAQLNLTDNTATQVVLGTEIYDVGSNFASNAYTAPTTGYYLVVANITYTTVTANKSYRSSIYVNDAEVARATQHSGLADTIAIPIYGIFNVTAGQTIKLYATQISGGNLVDIQDGSLYTFMHVVRLY